MRLRTPLLVVALFMASGVASVGCVGSNPGSPASSPAQSPDADVPLAARTVWAGSYARDIQPIFDQYCVSCHGASLAENGLRLDSYDGTVRGTQHGPVVVPGSPGTSTIAMVIQGNADPRIRMPHEGRRLSKNRIQNTLLWIEAGAPND